MCRFLVYAICLLATLTRTTAFAELKRREILSIEQQAQLKVVQNELGPIIRREEAPEMYALVDSAFNRLDKTFAERMQERLVAINYIYILNSPRVNAFVYSPKNPGVSLSRNLIFITSAMLRQLIDTNPDRVKEKDFPAEVRDGISRVAGILAHEFAHPFDTITYSGKGGDGLSFALEYGDRAKQAIELRTDAEAVELLRQSNLPEDGVYRASQRVMTNENSALVLDGSASHPNRFLRDSTMRLYLTVMRLGQGKNWNVRPIEPDQFNLRALREELESFAVGRGPNGWVPPGTLEETLRRMRTIFNLEHQELEYNRLLLHLDGQLQEIERDNKTVSAKLAKEIGELMAFIIKRDGPKVWTARSRRTELEENPGSAQFAYLPLHSIALSQLKIYSRPEYQQPILKAAESLQSRSNKGERDRTYSTLSQYLPRETFLKIFGQSWLELDHQILTSNPYMNKKIPDLDDSRLIFSFISDFAGWAEWDDDQSLSELFLQTVKKSYSLPFFLTSKSTYTNLYSNNERYRAFIGQLNVEARQNRRESARMLQAIRDHAQKLWNHRGKIALLELVARTMSSADAQPESIFIDWALIGEILGLDQNQIPNGVFQGVSELVRNQAAFRKFLRGLGKVANKGGELASMIRSVRTVNSDRTGDLIENDSLPVWYRSGFSNIGFEPFAPESDGDVLMGRVILVSFTAAHDTPFREQLYETVINRQLGKANGVLTFRTYQEVGSWCAELDNEFGKYFWLKSGEGASLSYLKLAEVIGGSQALNKKQKTQILQYLFLRPNRSVGKDKDGNQDEETDRFAFKWIELESDKLQKIVTLLRDQGIVDDVATIFEHLKQSEHYSPIHDVRKLLETDSELESSLEKYYSFVDRMGPALRGEISHVRRWNLALLKRYIDILNTPRRLKVMRSVTNAANIQDLRSDLANIAVQMVGKWRLNLNSKLNLFLDLTATGGCYECDAFFKAEILPSLGVDGGVTRNWIKGILLTNRLSSPQLRLELTKEYFEPKLVEMEKVGSSKDELYALISDLNQMIGTGSIGRDDYLESIAIRLKLRNAPLFAFIEDQKTSNWRREDPILVNSGSMIVNGISKLSTTKRRSLLHYLIAPAKSREGLPEQIVEEFFQIALRDLISENEHLHKQRKKSLVETNAKARRASRLFKLQVDHYLRDSAPKERIPLIEATLTAGASALISAPDFPLNLTREFLRYEPEGFAEKGLIEYLSLVDPHEVAPSLAYLISQAGEEKGTVADIFTLFGVPGKKFGQFSSIFQIFGPEVAAESTHLKNHAPPMTLFQIYDQMDKILPADISARLHVTSILGSASVKTVAAAVDSQNANLKIALHLRDPHIENQNRTHLDMGRRFLQRMIDQGLVKSTRVLGALLESLDSLLEEEIDFKREAQKSDLLSQILSHYNQEAGASLGGWTFSTPQRLSEYPLNSEIAAYEFAEGVPFDQLPKKLARELGPQIVRLSLGMLFRYNYFDPDRHLGNWLIDSKTRKIHFLDPGQLESFTADETVEDPMIAVFEFLLGISGKNVKGVYEAMAKMRNPGSALPPLNRELSAAVESALQKADLGEVIVDLLNAFLEADFHLQRRFIFGLGKGMITLYGEKYVSPEEFLKILQQEAQAAYLKRLLGARPPKFEIAPINCEKALGG